MSFDQKIAIFKPKQDRTQIRKENMYNSRKIKVGSTLPGLPLYLSLKE